LNKKHLNYAENFFIVLGFLFLSGTLGNLRIFPSVIISLTRYYIAFGSVFIISTRFKLLAYKSKRNPYLLAVITLGLTSFIWSDSPGHTLFLIRGQLFPMTAFGLYLATSFDVKTLLKKLSYAATVSLLLNFFAVIAMPSVGIESGKFAGAWKGTFIQKNTASSYMVLTALTLLLSSFRSSYKKLLGIYKHIWLRWLGLSALGFIFLTTSGTGLVLSILIAFALFSYFKFRWQGKITLLFIDIAILLIGSSAIILISNWSEILTNAGKDPTLTGRTVFWSIAIQAIWRDKPLLGFGRGEFWNPNGSYVSEIRRAFGANIYSDAYLPAHAHNGFIELGLDIGFIGLGLFFVSLLITWIRSFQQGYNTNELENLFPLGFMIFFIINNITESYTAYLSNIFWPLYIALALNAGRWNLKRPNPKLSIRQLSMRQKPI
jgi:exopolysaccharide production protein ExoQ